MELKQIDKLNRLHLPVKFCKEIGLTQETVLKVEIKDGAIVLQPVEVKDTKFKVKGE